MDEENWRRRGEAAVQLIRGIAGLSETLADLEFLIRAPVGANVVIGQFEILRSLRVVDLDVLSEVYEAGSHFDADFVRRGAKPAFLQHVVSEMTRPVMPSDEAKEYLLTQAVAGYFGQKVARIRGIPA